MMKTIKKIKNVSRIFSEYIKGHQKIGKCVKINAFFMSFVVL